VPTRVCVVDDDPDMCELIHGMLRSAEIDSSCFNDSREAARRLAKEKFDAIFLDVRMPAPDGIELARLIRASGINQSTPIVVITGEGENAVLTRAFQAGATFFLFKPIDRHRMLRLLRVTEGTIQNEARRYQRVKVSCKVGLESGLERLNGTTLDLSLGGMFVQAPHAFPLGSSVNATLELKAKTQPLHFSARVVRVAGADCMGLRIENAGPEEIRILQDFLLPLILTKTGPRQTPNESVLSK
jgi:CheY-like chemotaxis protein